jgi:MoxR-like ATPase
MILDLFRKDNEFHNIQGYDDLKDIVGRVLDAEDNYNLLFVGPPASSKTLFLLGILECKKGKGVYFDGSNTTNRILDVLEEKRPKIICIDELDKVPKHFQDKLLNFMESGHIKVDQMRKQYDFKIQGAKVFAACNDITKLSRPLLSRFRRLHLPRYTEEQFLDVSAKVLPNLKIAQVIGKAVWNQRGDIRDVISIGKLVRKNDGPVEVQSLLNTMVLLGRIVRTSIF